MFSRNGLTKWRKQEVTFYPLPSLILPACLTVCNGFDSDGKLRPRWCHQTVHGERTETVFARAHFWFCLAIFNYYSKFLRHRRTPSERANGCLHFAVRKKFKHLLWKSWRKRKCQKLLEVPPPLNSFFSFQLQHIHEKNDHIHFFSFVQNLVIHTAAHEERFVKHYRSFFSMIWVTFDFKVPKMF